MAITARWRKRTSSRWLAGAMIILLATGPTRASQQAQAGTAGEPGPGEAEAPPPVETEFVASTIFQEATMVARLSSPLSLDAHWFGVEGNDIGVIGVLTRDRLLDEVWGYDATPVSRTVDVHVASLRAKVETNPSHPEFLVTVHRVGYRFDG